MKQTLKPLIWLYVFLLIGEGALRKWILPGLSDALLIVRDPVLLLIYVEAIRQGVVRWNHFMTTFVVMATLAVGLSLANGQDNPAILAYGLRTNFLHFPLIWVMAETLDRRDVDYLGIAVLGAAVLMTPLMVRQFSSAPDAYVNRGVGLAGGENLQIFGADGRIRPPGFFAFITGPQLFFPLAAAFLFGQLTAVRRRLPWPLLTLAAVSITIALPVSISRSTAVGTLVVGACFLFTLPYLSGSIASRVGALFRIGLVLGVLAAALSRLPVFSQASDVFLMRWLDTGSETSGWTDIILRSIDEYVKIGRFVADAPIFGHGIGMGSNVAARLLYGAPDIVLAEEEWGKNILELGPLLGLAYIGLRFTLVFYCAAKALTALRHEQNPLPLLILAACALAVTQGQLGPPTVLGFAVIGPGLLLAALKTDAPADGPATPTAPTAAPPTVAGADPRIPAASDRRPPANLR